MNKVIDFLTTKSTLFGDITIENWTFIAGVLLVLMLIFAVVIAIKSKKHSKEAITSEPTQETADKKEEVIEEKETTPIREAYAFVETTPTNEVTSSEPFVLDNGNFVKNTTAPSQVAEEKTADVEQAPVAEPVVEEVKAEEKAVVKEPIKTAPIVEKEPEPIKQEVVKEEPVVEETKPVVEEKPVPVAKTETPVVEKVVEKEAVVEEKPVVEEKTARPLTKAKGKFEVCNSSLGGFKYRLKANNGQLLYESNEYKSIDSCATAIEKFVNSVLADNFYVRADKFGNFRFILKSATSNTQIFIGESFADKYACQSNIESVKRFATVESLSNVVDMTESNFEVSAIYYPIPDALVSDVENKIGAIGKWLVEKVSEDADSPYTYLLYANNGQLLFESRDYKTEKSCRDGLKTFVNTVKNGAFVVDPDKAGRYAFVLRSRKNGAQMTYNGPSYDTKSACLGNIESVYKFALLSPIE